MTRLNGSDISFLLFLTNVLKTQFKFYEKFDTFLLKVREHTDRHNHLSTFNAQSFIIFWIRVKEKNTGKITQHSNLASTPATSQKPLRRVRRVREENPKSKSSAPSQDCRPAGTHTLAVPLLAELAVYNIFSTIIPVFHLEGSFASRSIPLHTCSAACRLLSQPTWVCARRAPRIHSAEREGEAHRRRRKRPSVAYEQRPDEGSVHRKSTHCHLSHVENSAEMSVSPSASPRRGWCASAVRVCETVERILVSALGPQKAATQQKPVHRLWAWKRPSIHPSAPVRFFQKSCANAVCVWTKEFWGYFLDYK